MTGPAIRTEVFYLNPRAGWAAAAFDAEGNQIGEAVCAFHQRTAIREAGHIGRDLPCHVFKRDGELGRVIPAPPRSVREGAA